MKIFRIASVACLALFSNGVQAATFDTFAPGIEITSAALSAVVTNSTVDFHNFSPATFSGNTIDDEAFKGAMGVFVINQNSGINAVVQQAVAVRTGNITFDISN